MRVTKRYDVRLNEILDAAEVLFAQAGYEKTTVNNVLEKVGIGKGTFYHYFQSKEELADEVITRAVEYIAGVVSASQAKPAQNTLEALQNLLPALRIAESPHQTLFKAMGNPHNALLHQKFIVKSIGLLTPILAAIAERGIEEGLCQSDYPYETLEILLAATHVIYNWNIMGKTDDELALRAAALIRMAELSFGIPKDGFKIFLSDN